MAHPQTICVRNSLGEGDASNGVYPLAGVHAPSSVGYLFVPTNITFN